MITAHATLNFLFRQVFTFSGILKYFKLSFTVSDQIALFRSILLIAQLSILCSCSEIIDKITNMTECPPASKTYMVFLPDIIPYVDSSKFELVPNKKGLWFPFCKIENAVSGLTISGRAQYRERVSGQIVSFMTGVSVTPKKDQAISLFNTDKKLGVLYKKSIITLNKNDYKVDNIFCIQDSTRFYILLQKEQFLISFDIDNIAGFSLNEKSLRGIFNRKMRDALLQLYSGKDDN